MNCPPHSSLRRTLAGPREIVLSEDATTESASTLVTWLSLVPPCSPILMPARIALDVVPLWQIGVSAAVTVVAIIAVIVLAGRFYAGAVLRTGSRVKLADALRPM